LVAIISTILSLTILSGCERRADASAPLREVRLAYFANATHAQAVLGISSGDFARAVAPLVIKPRVFNAGPALLEAMFAGEVDIAYVGPGPALAGFQHSRGKGLRVVAGSAGGGVVIVARRDLGATTIDDLKGKRIATPQYGNTQDLSARHFMTARFGASALNDVVPISNAEQASLMKRGDIDAAWAPEPWGQRLITEAGATLVAEEKDLWPGKAFTLTVVVTTPEFLAQHPDVVERILRVHADWTAKLAASPATYAEPLGEALFALTGKHLPAGVLPAALKRVRFSTDPGVASFEAFNTWSKELGFSRSSTPLTSLIDTLILQRLLSTPAAHVAT
jgi:NitT/TauT family transport system substrate-binding protein